jgi:7-keto-8-aminopelargonate synthetase-like enzyme
MWSLSWQLDKNIFAKIKQSTSCGYGATGGGGIYGKSGLTANLENDCASCYKDHVLRNCTH